MISSLYSSTNFINKNKKTIPTIMHECNKYMAGADRFDQAIAYYKYPHRLNKCGKIVSFTFLK